MKKKEIKILLVDDEPDILEIVGYTLRNEGYTIFTAENGQIALDQAKKIAPHLILMDIMMPKMNGIEACEEIRKIESLNETIISFLTASGEDYAQVAGFDAGADDYITKPVKPKVLVSKVKSLLRRIKSPGSENLIIAGSITVNRDKYIVTKNGVNISLPRKEFELISLLSSEPGKVFNRDVILNRVWGTNVIVGARTIDVHIRKLREKIGDNYFQTIKGVGYKFVSDQI